MIIPSKYEDDTVSSVMHEFIQKGAVIQVMCHTNIKSGKSELELKLSLRRKRDTNLENYGVMMAFYDKVKSMDLDLFELINEGAVE